MNFSASCLQRSFRHQVKSRAARAQRPARLAVGLLAPSLLAPLAISPTLGLAAAAGLAASIAPAAHADTAPDKLPIQRITLYRSGVGSFQRGGEVAGDSVVHLKFNTDQVNDILKSMVVLDLSGGRVGSIAYGSKDPLAKRLGSFGIDISDNPSLSQLMERLRGTPISLTTYDTPVSGTILGVEMRQVVENQATAPIITPFLTLVTPTGIRAVDFRLISSFEIQDKELAADLNKALAAMAEQRAERVKTVDISLLGDGQREIAIAYIHETPVWKTSYRLVLPDGESTGEDRRPETSREGRKPEPPAAEAGRARTATLQGWAIVENTTDEDWKDVRLSLVSGQPVSFRMDLYEPLYSFRPQVPVPTIPGVAPRIFEGGQSMVTDGVAQEKAKLENIRGHLEMTTASRRMAGQSPAPAAAPAADMSGRGGLAYLGQEVAEIPAAARGGEVGESFQYQLSEPVTIQRQQSAMLPIISEGIRARRVSIYSRGDNAGHPSRGVEITNTSGLQLLPGPITVFDAGSYAGDAQIGHVTPGDHRLLAYAVDLDVEAIVEDQSSSTINKIRIVNGMFEQTVKQVNSTKYSFSNKDARRARTLIVEQPRLGGWDLAQGEVKPSEKTESIYRFELKLDAAARGEDGSTKAKPTPLTIAQERTDRQLIGLMDFDFSALMRYAQDGKVSQKVVEVFREAAARKRLVDDAQRKVRDLETERGEIDKEQGRIRENMKTVDKASQIYSRYMQKLDTQETRLEAIIKEIEAARANVQKLQQEFQQYVAGLNVE